MPNLNFKTFKDITTECPQTTTATIVLIIILVIVVICFCVSSSVSFLARNKICNKLSPCPVAETTTPVTAAGTTSA